MNTGTVVVKNKKNGTEKIFKNVFNVTTESGMFIIHYDVNKKWLYDESEYDYEWVVERCPTKETLNINETIMQLEKENEKLKRVIVNMCKSAFGGE